MEQVGQAIHSESQWIVERILAEADLPHFDSWASFNHYCRHILDLWRLAYTPGAGTSTTFVAHWDAIRSNAPRTVRTPWGGIHITAVQLPNVEQYVAIEGGRYTPFEKHLERVESLLALSGTGVFVYRSLVSKAMQADAIVPGYSITLLPEQEHAVIALEDLLLFERVTDIKGEDEDRVVVFEALL